MRESVIYQDIEALGIQKGLQQGKVEEGRSLILKQLTRKVGTIPPDVRSQVEALTIDPLEALGEALLDFETLADLITWLAQPA